MPPCLLDFLPSLISDLVFDFLLTESWIRKARGRSGVDHTAITLSVGLAGLGQVKNRCDPFIMYIKEKKV